MSWPLLTKIYRCWGHVPGWPKAGAGTDVFRGSPSADQHRSPAAPRSRRSGRSAGRSAGVLRGPLRCRKYATRMKELSTSSWLTTRACTGLNAAPKLKQSTSMHQCNVGVLIYSTFRSSSLFSSLPGISRNCVVDHFRGMACVFFEMDSSTTVTSIPRSARRWYPSFLLVSEPSWSMDVPWGLYTTNLISLMKTNWGS